MGIKCLVCPNKFVKYEQTILKTFHRFPKDIERCKRWAILCNRPDLINVNPEVCFRRYKLCSDHFEAELFNNNRLNYNAIPSIFSWSLDVNKPNKLNAVKEIKDIDLSNTCVISNLHPKLSLTSRYSDNEYSEYQSFTSKLNPSISVKTSIKSKLDIMLKSQDNKFNELHKQFYELHNQYLLLKNDNNNHEKMCSSKYFNLHVIYEKFLEKGFSNFVKVQSKLLFKFQTLNEHGYSFEIKYFALMIHFLGPTVYQFLEKFWCLPSPRTLQSTFKNWDINPGYNNFLFKVLAVKANSMKPRFKECVLCVGEMSLKSSLFYNYKKDIIVGFHNTDFLKSNDLAKSVMVVMVHGLHDSWKQLVGYFFVSSSFTGFDLKNLIFLCIQKLDSISFNVKVIISDLSENFKLFSSEQNITTKTPYFNVGLKEIVFMFDPLHLLNLTRNHFFNYRLKMGNKILDKIHLTKFYNYDKRVQHLFAPKLTDAHINPNSFQKKKVEYAADIFSQTVVAGMTALVYSDKLSTNSFATIDFIDSMDKLHDIFNSHLTSNKRYHCPFSNSSFQSEFLNYMSIHLKKLEIQKFNATKNEWINISRKRINIFIGAWLISIAGLIRLHFNLSIENQFNIELCTHRLNRKCLNNFFETVKIQNKNCTKPTSNQFKCTYKKIFFTNYFERYDGANCFKDLDDILVSYGSIPLEEIKIIFPQKNCVDTPLTIGGIHTYKYLNLSEHNPLPSICSYLIRQCLKMHKCEVCMNYAQLITNLSSEQFYIYLKVHDQNPYLPCSDFIVPKSTFYQYICQLDLLFNKMFTTLAPELNVGTNIRNSMLNSIFFYHPCKDFPKGFLINLFVRLSIYNVVYRINKDCQSSRIKRKNKKVEQ